MSKCEKCGHETVRVVCLGCGTGTSGATLAEAWERVCHEGHGHRAEEMTVEQALECGQALQTE